MVEARYSVKSVTFRVFNILRNRCTVLQLASVIELNPTHFIIRAFLY